MPCLPARLPFVLGSVPAVPAVAPALGLRPNRAASSVAGPQTIVEVGANHTRQGVLDPASHDTSHAHAAVVHGTAQQAVASARGEAGAGRRQIRPTVVAMSSVLTDALMALNEGNTVTLGKGTLFLPDGFLHSASNLIAANHCVMGRDTRGRCYVRAVHKNGFSVQRGKARFDIFDGHCTARFPDGSISQSADDEVELIDGDIVLFSLDVQPELRVVGFKFKKPITPVASPLPEQPKPREVKKFVPPTPPAGIRTFEPAKAGVAMIQPQRPYNTTRMQMQAREVMRGQLMSMARGNGGTYILGLENSALFGDVDPRSAGLLENHARISFEQGRYVLRTDHPLFVLRDGDEIAVGRHQQGLRNSHLILRNGDVIVFKKYTLTFKVILPFSLLSDVTRDWDTEMRAWSYVATLSDVIRLFSEAQETVRGRANVIVEVPVYHDIPPEALDEIDAHCRRALRTYPRLAGYQLVRARNLGGCKPHTTDMFYCDPPVFEIDIARTISVSDAPRTIAHQPDATCMVTPSRLRDIVNATEEYRGHRLGDVVTVLRTRQGLRGPVKVPERGWTITAFDTLRQRVTVRRAMTADEVTQHAANGFIDGVKRILFGHVERPNELELTVPLEYIATDQQIFDAVNGEQTAFWHLSRRVALLRDHAKMTYAEFQALFGGEFHQQNVGNCYLISVLKALTSDPENFEALMRLSIRPVKEGWEVTVPLGLLNGRKIIITRENLRPCHNPHRGEPDYSRPDEIDSRKSLEPVSGPDGYRILEAVYCKLLKGERGATYVPVDRSVIDQGGFSREAIVTLLGDGIIAERLQLDESLSGQHPNHLSERGMAYLLNFHNGKDVATTSTNSNGQFGQLRFTDPVTRESHTIRHRHAYTIASVEFEYPRNQQGQKEVRFVVLFDPHDNNKRIRLSLTAYLWAFRKIDACELAMGNLFK